jgi:hypothetical protein
MYYVVFWNYLIVNFLLFNSNTLTLIHAVCCFYLPSMFHTHFPCILRSECGGTRWRTEGEVKGKLVDGVGSQYSHTTSERDVSSITNADAHTSAASSCLNWLPRRFKWTRPFRRKTKSGFCTCAIRFLTSSTSCFSLPYLLKQRHGTLRFFLFRKYQHPFRLRRLSCILTGNRQIQ